jgi:hypothetical protein
MAQCNNSLTGNVTKQRFSFFIIVFRTAGIRVLIEKVRKLFKIYIFVANKLRIYIFYVSDVLVVFMCSKDLRCATRTAEEWLQQTQSHTHTHTHLPQVHFSAVVFSPDSVLNVRNHTVTPDSWGCRDSLPDLIIMPYWYHLKHFISFISLLMHQFFS